MLEHVILLASVITRMSLASRGLPPEVWAAWISGVAAIVTALIAGIATLRSQRQSRLLEKEKLELDDRFSKARTLWEEERRELTERALADQQFDEQLQIQAEEANALQRQALDYRRKVVQRLRHLKILDMSRPLDLDRLYVQLLVRQEESPRFVTEDSIAEIASGEPERLLRISRDLLKTGAAGAIAPEEALRRFQRMVVVGDPGAGKTTMLRHLAFKIAREEMQPGMTFPVYVELRDFVDSGAADLLKHAAAEMNHRYGFADAQPYIESELAVGRAVLLFDGLDEVLGGASEEAAETAYRMVAAEIDRLATRYPSAPMAVTCRRAGWRGGLPEFQSLEVLDFDWPEIQAFVNNWFGADLSRRDGLHDALSSNLRMQTLAANPLLLSLICIVYERDLELPERRSQLYSRCVEVLLKDWDAHREIRRYSRFTTDRKRDLLEEVAWHFHRAGRRYFPQGELIAIIADFLPTIDLSAEHAETILNEIVTQYGLLKVQAHGWLGFLHLTLQEYFAAVAVNERGQTAISEVVYRRHNPWWEEVILLLAGRMADASPLLLSLLGRSFDEADPEGPLAKDDDIFMGDLLLAARCLIGTPRLRLPWLRERIVGEVRNVLAYSPHDFLCRRAARVLAEIGGKSITAALISLIHDDAVELKRRAAAAIALAEARNATVAPHLLAALKHQEDPLSSLGEALARGLAKLGYKPALPILLDILRKEASSTEEQGPSFHVYAFIDAVSSLGDASVKSDIWIFIRDVVQGRSALPLNPLVRTVTRLGNADDTRDLLALAENGEFEEEVYSTIGSMDKSVVATRLLDIITKPNIDEFVLPSTVRVIVRFKDQIDVKDIMRIVADAKVEWKRRWLLAGALAEYPRQACEAKLVEMLASDIDPRVKVGIAVTLAKWENASSIPVLRAVFEEGATLPWQVLFEASSGGSYGFYAWSQVTTALQRLGDVSLVRTLLARHERALSDGDYQSAEHVASALGPFKTVDLVRQILSHIPRKDSGHYYELGYMLASAAGKSTLPLVLDALKVGKVQWDDVRYAISALADTPDEAKQLAILFLQHGDGPYPDGMAEVLDDVCRKAGVRVFHDRRVLGIEN